MIINIIDKGADSTGVIDSTLAIQVAHDSLPSKGGTIYIPAGDYWIENFNVIKNDIKILGDGVPGLPGEAGLQINGPTRIFVKNQNSYCLRFKGPLIGLSLENLHLDGNLNGHVGLWETSIVRGDHRNVLFTGWMNTSHLIDTIPSQGFVTAHERNRYLNFTYFLPPISCTGLSISGNNIDDTNADFNIWESTNIFVNRPQHELAQHCISLGDCDSNVFRDTSFWYWDAGANLSTVIAILLNNQDVNKLPTQNTFDNIDFAGGSGGVHFTPIYNYGDNLPPNNWLSVIIKGISPVNGYTPDPKLVNVKWLVN